MLKGPRRKKWSAELVFVAFRWHFLSFIRINFDLINFNKFFKFSMEIYEEIFVVFPKYCPFPSDSMGKYWKKVSMFWLVCTLRWWHRIHTFFFVVWKKKMFDQIGASRAVWLTCRGFLFFVQWTEVQRAEVATTGGHDRWSRGRRIRPDSSRLRAASERRRPFIDQCGRRSCKCSFIRLLWICMAWTWIVGLLFASGSSGWIHNYDHDPRFVEFSEI